MSEEQRPYGEWTTLASCPIGLFRSERGELCLKTEYRGDDGRIEAYVVSTGEFFWGGTSTATAQRMLAVKPVAADVSEQPPMSPERFRQEQELQRECDRRRIADGLFGAFLASWADGDTEAAADKAVEATDALLSALERSRG